MPQSGASHLAKVTKLREIDDELPKNIFQPQGFECLSHDFFNVTSAGRLYCDLLIMPHDTKTVSE